MDRHHFSDFYQNKYGNGANNSGRNYYHGKRAPHFRRKSPPSHTTVASSSLPGKGRGKKSSGLVAAFMSTAGSGEGDDASAVSGHIETLRSKTVRTRRIAARAIRTFVESERGVSGSRKLLSSILARVSDWANHSDANDRLGYIALVDELIEVVDSSEGDAASKKIVIGFANQLQILIKDASLSSSTNETQVLGAATRALGHIAREHGALVSVFIEYEITRSLQEWLREKESEARRFAAVLVLRRLAENTPALFKRYIDKTFFDQLWVGLKDPKNHIRECTALALRACFRIISPSSLVAKRWYSLMFGKAREVLRRSGGIIGVRITKDTASLHGAMLTLLELLDEKCAGKFMAPHFHEVWGCVNHKAMLGHKEKTVRDSVVALMPLLARFCPASETVGFLRQCVGHLLENTEGKSTHSRRGSAFVALGRLCVAVGGDLFAVHAREVLVRLKECLSQRSSPTVDEALVCLSALVTTMASSHNMRTIVEAWVSSFRMLLFSGGLSETLLDLLVSLVRLSPKQLPPVRLRLLEELLIVLGCLEVGDALGNERGRAVSDRNDASTGFRALLSNKAAHWLHGGGNASLLETVGSDRFSLEFRDGTQQRSILQCLALRALTIKIFKFEEVTILPVVRAAVITYLDHPQVEVRRSATKACFELLRSSSAYQRKRLELLERRKKEKPKTNTYVPLGLDQVGEATEDNVLDGALPGEAELESTLVLAIERLIILTMTDEDNALRCEVLLSLNRYFPDRLYSNAENLRSVFILANDHEFSVRAAAVSTLGHLANRNPSYVLPGLRTLIVQLITRLEFGSQLLQRARARISEEESATQIGLLFRAMDAELARPYVGAAIRGLLPKLRDFNLGVSTAAMAAIGEIANVDVSALMPFGDYILSVISANMSETSTSTVLKREVTLRALSQFSFSAGVPVWPYFFNRSLLDQILHVIVSGGGHATAQLRRQALSTIGNLGALSPWLHQLNRRALKSGSSGISQVTIRRMKQPDKQPEQADEAKIVGKNTHLYLETDVGRAAADEARCTSPQSGRGIATARLFPDAAAVNGWGKWSGSKYKLVEAMARDFAAGDGSGSSAKEESANEDEDENILEVGSILPASLPAHKYYPTVAFAALSKVLRDSSLSTHHKKAIEAMMLVCTQSLGKFSSEFLPQIISPILRVMQNCSKEGGRANYNFQLFLLSEIGKLVEITGPSIADHLSSIVSLCSDLWQYSSPVVLPGVLGLVEQIAKHVPSEDLRIHLPALLPKLFSVLDDEHAGMYTGGGSASDVFHNSPSVLRGLSYISGVLEDYIFLVVPALMRLINRESTRHSVVPQDVRSEALRALLKVVRTNDQIANYGTQVMHPLVKAVESEARNAMSKSNKDGNILAPLLEALVAMVYRLEEEYAIWIPIVARAFDQSGLNGAGTNATEDVAKLLNRYDKLAYRVMMGRKIPVPRWARDQDNRRCNFLNGFDGFVALGEGEGEEGKETAIATFASRSINADQLKKCWDAGQRATEADWQEWMRRFSLGVLVGSPQPALHYCAALAQVFQPLARALFNSAFISCWAQISEDTKNHLLRSLESALQSETIPAAIMQSLLNLAEFMEHDDSPLPIDIRELGKHALKCHAYAKALHYKELEFQIAPQACISHLIAINNNLELPEAAKGVVEYAMQQNESDIELQPLWYEKLGKWQQALAAYEHRAHVEARRLAKGGISTESHMEHIVGRLRCNEALGNWRSMLQVADEEFKSMSASISSESSDDRKSRRASDMEDSSRPRKNSYLLSTPASALVRNVSQYNDSPRGSGVTEATLIGRSSTSQLTDDEYDSEDDTDNGSDEEDGGQRGIAFSNLNPMHSSEDSSDHDEPNSPHAERARKSRFSARIMRPTYTMSEMLRKKSSSYCRKIAKFAAFAAWNLGDWQQVERFVPKTDSQKIEGQFLRAVLDIHSGKHEHARRRIRRANEILEGVVPALVGESYSRAYSRLVKVQQLVELAEVVDYQDLLRNGRHGAAAEYRNTMLRRWHQRIQCVQRNVDVYQQILMVRSLVLSPHENMDTWLNFAKICRKRGRLRLCLKALMNLGVGKRGTASRPKGVDFSSALSPLSENGVPGGCETPSQSDDASLLNRLAALADDSSGETPSSSTFSVRLANLDPSGPAFMARRKNSILPHRFSFRPGTPRRRSIIQEDNLSPLIPRLRFDTSVPVHPAVVYTYVKLLFDVGAKEDALNRLQQLARYVESKLDGDAELRRLAVKSHVKIGEWMMKGNIEKQLAPEAHRGKTTYSLDDVLHHYDRATKLDSQSYKAWHAYALMNYRSVERTRLGSSSATEPSTATQSRLTRSKSFAVRSRLIPAVNALFRSIALGTQQGVNVLQDILRLLTLWFEHSKDKNIQSAVRENLDAVGLDTWLGVIPQLIARVDAENDLVCDLLTRIGMHHPQLLIYPLTVAANSSNRSRAVAAGKIMSAMRAAFPVLVEEAEIVSAELRRVAVLWDEMWHEGLESASNMYFGNEKDVESMISTLKGLHDSIDSGSETMQEVGFEHSFARDLNEAKSWFDAYIISKDVHQLNQAWDLYVKVFHKIKKQLDRKQLHLRQVSPRLLNARNLQLAVPGTYLSSEVRIRSFSPLLRVISSKQRPRVVTMQGSDGLDYMFLLKGHEDLRLDERVMQLFGLVNALLAQDPDTSKLGLECQRYSVTPLSSKCGLMSWVQNCQTLHQLIVSFRESKGIPINVERRLMYQFTGDYDKLSVPQKVEIFLHARNETRGNDIKSSLYLLSENSEVWLTRRTNYTRSLAAMSMVGYILGLGDRHPSNIMIEKSSGRALHIDFGDCFEVAQKRDKFPERVPFRLTRMLVNAMEVSGIEGTYRSTCESVMSVLRDNSESVLTLLEAFIHDPLINWRLLKKGDDDEEEGKDGENEARESLNERALDILERIRSKLNGLDFATEGGLESDVKSQVNHLIEEATSIEHLASAYQGWCSFW